MTSANRAIPVFLQSGFTCCHGNLVGVPKQSRYICMGDDKMIKNALSSYKKPKTLRKSLVSFYSDRTEHK